MPTKLNIHKQAVMIEYYLNQIVDKMNNTKNSTMADITMVYDQPIRLCSQILLHVQDRCVSREYEEAIQSIRQKYWPYQACILSQIDDTVCNALCDDLKALSN